MSLKGIEYALCVKVTKYTLLVERMFNGGIKVSAAN